jgi:pyruvate kinase
MENYQNPTWTKYICTLGRTSNSPEVIEGLIRGGASILRNNFAHAQYDEYLERVRIVKEINARLGTKVQMHADLQGPNIRVGTFPDGGMEIEADKEYCFYTAAGEAVDPTDIFINDQTLHLDVKAGEPITFMDGAIEGEITKVEGHRIWARMINSGFLKDRKSVNVPETDLTSPAITEKDYKDIAFLLEAGVDWIALSFVSTRNELDEVRKMIGDRPIKIVSKIERKAAMVNLVEIIDASDAVMIARGDLGIEVPMEEVPLIQRRITNLCHNMDKPVITATQMLLSLAKSKRPTRAEVSDVANAVWARSDAVMLSEETADGVDPVNAITTMVKIARRAEEFMYNRPNHFEGL